MTGSGADTVGRHTGTGGRVEVLVASTPYDTLTRNHLVAWRADIALSAYWAYASQTRLMATLADEGDSQVESFRTLQALTCSVSYVAVKIGSCDTGKSHRVVLLMHRT